MSLRIGRGILVNKMVEVKKDKKKKFKILAASDFHGDSVAAERLAKKAKKEKVDLIILAGDIIGMSDTDNLLKPFTDRGEKVVFVPGNWDSSETARFLSKLYGVKNIGEHYVMYGDVGIFGVGSPDWQLELDENKSFKKLKKEFEGIKKQNLEKTIMVSHLNPADTKTEFSGIAGSKAVKKAIKEFQPDIFLSGHIHEAEGLTEKVGKTKLFSIGKKGKIIEI